MSVLSIPVERKVSIHLIYLPSQSSQLSHFLRLESAPRPWRQLGTDLLNLFKHLTSHFGREKVCPCSTCSSTSPHTSTGRRCVPAQPVQTPHLTLRQGEGVSLLNLFKHLTSHLDREVCPCSTCSNTSPHTSTGRRCVPAQPVQTPHLTLRQGEGVSLLNLFKHLTSHLDREVCPCSTCSNTSPHTSTGRCVPAQPVQTPHLTPRQGGVSLLNLFKHLTSHLDREVCPCSTCSNTSPHTSTGRRCVPGAAVHSCRGRGTSPKTSPACPQESYYY